MAAFNPQWRDQQAFTKYPFEDGASLMSYEGAAIPPDVLLDASLYPVGGAARLFLSAVVVAAGTASIYIGTETNPSLCVAAFATSEPPDDIAVYDSYGRPAGVLVSETIRLSVFQTWRFGTYTFAPDATPFVASVCIPLAMPGVLAMRPDSGELFTGEVILYGEKGVVLRLDAESTPGMPLVRVDVVGEPLFRRSQCEDPEAPAQFASRNYLRTVNHIPGDEFGNFMLTTAGNVAPDNILRIYPTAEGIRFEAVGQSVGDM